MHAMSVQCGECVCVLNAVDLFVAQKLDCGAISFGGAHMMQYSTASSVFFAVAAPLFCPEKKKTERNRTNHAIE